MKSFQKYKKKYFSRAMRVSQELQKEISIILQNYIKDPRINFMTTVSMVRVSHDLSYAKIFVSYLDNYNNESHTSHNVCNITEILNILKHASSYIRKILSCRLNLRIIPVLNFYYDNSLLEGIKISNLIQSARYTIE